MALILVVLFIGLPLVELYVLIQVGELIGVLPAIGLLLAVSILGGWLVRREGARAWQAFRTATGEGRVPGREVADGALVMLGGALLLTPGFVTDVFGLLLLLRPTRALLRRLALGWVTRRVKVVEVVRTTGNTMRDSRGTQRVQSTRLRPDGELGEGDEKAAPPGGGR